MAEYKFSQNTEFIHRRVPGISSNILRKNSQEFFTLHSNSSLPNTWLSTRNRISAPFVFHNPLYPQSSVLGCSSCVLEDTVFTFFPFDCNSESIDCEQKLLDFEGHTWGAINTPIHTYIGNPRLFKCVYWQTVNTVPCQGGQITGALQEHSALLCSEV